MHLPLEAIPNAMWMPVLARHPNPSPPSPPKSCCLQEVAADAQAGADAAAADEDWNPNFSDSDGLSSASGGKDPYLSARVLEQQIK